MLRYTKTAVVLHWLIALLLVAAFTIGTIMVDLPGITPTKLKYFSWHKWLGVTVLGLVCIRLLWRLAHRAPPYPENLPQWQRRAAGALHGLMYVLMFAVPFSGYFYTLSAGVPVVYLGIVPLPVLMAPNPALKPLLQSLHYVLTMTLLAAVCLHLLATLKHHFVDHDGVLKRMLF